MRRRVFMRTYPQACLNVARGPGRDYRTPEQIAYDAIDASAQRLLQKLRDEVDLDPPGQPGERRFQAFMSLFGVTRQPAIRTLRRFARRQDEDGAWAGDFEETCVALALFAEHGHTASAGEFQAQLTLAEDWASYRRTRDEDRDRWWAWVRQFVARVPAEADPAEPEEPTPAPYRPRRGL